ncbi:hypothetical protein NDU88_005835 [Pleurodeles waltl]|uniref:Uncharacterized protein n=1 Tax=Pleurodeles waltl TaxID=8319 RepID=A0AAV7TD34_PLEWA|nr:hypothetical protein NDU88_005835 [Pleurodeles waltl]
MGLEPSPRQHKLTRKEPTHFSRPHSLPPTRLRHCGSPQTQTLNEQLTVTRRALTRGHHSLRDQPMTLENTCSCFSTKFAGACLINLMKKSMAARLGCIDINFRGMKIATGCWRFVPALPRTPLHYFMVDVLRPGAHPQWLAGVTRAP